MSSLLEAIQRIIYREASVELSTKEGEIAGRFQEENG
jgi:hypothetical protein